ncbi:glycoside hydrolase family 76 protein [Streptomyces sp. NBC_00057]|uniref:glycoside hydrolase family 76 protein n=1 Tax=Streptomyces sp. NBC_00057 TaxID=2975634 RepID=UPI0038672691
MASRVSRSVGVLDTTYRRRARDEWAWFRAGGMINGSGTVNNVLTAACANNGDTAWTYNQGVVLAGLAELHRATGDGSLLDSARAPADASTSSGYLNPGATLHEPYEPDGTGCTSNSYSPRPPPRWPTPLRHRRCRATWTRGC